jgi:hypothetical protein
MAQTPQGAYTNWAEEFFSRMRRAEIGTTIISLVSISSATRKRRLGARITARQTAIR